MDGEVAAPAPRHAGACDDCDGTGCALRGLCATTAPKADPPALPRPNRLQALARWSARPAVRHRLPSLLVLVAASAATAGSPHAPALLALTVGTALALWWSAPRATPPGWTGLLVFAACAAVLAGPGASRTDWLPVAVGLGMAALRLRPAAAVGAFALCALAMGLGSVAGGHPPLWTALGWSGLGAAVGVLVGERRRFAAREQQLLSSLALASAQAVLDANPDSTTRGWDAGLGRDSENPKGAGLPEDRAEG